MTSRGEKVTSRKVARRFVVPLAIAAMLIGSVSAEAAQTRLKAGEEATFAIPRMSKPPTLDGTIDPVEWREAVAISGTTDVGSGLLDPRPATFLLAWDAQHLYMGCRVYMPAGYKPLLGGGRVPDGADCFDDGLELLMKPMGANVSEQNHRTEFKFNISCLGYGGTYTRLAVGQIMANWEPAEMKTAVRTTEPGTGPNGGAWWEMEVAFSTKDFELVGDNRAGDEWLMMLGINHMPKIGWMQERIPCVGSYFTPQGKCRATLVENTPAVKMTMDSLSNLASDGTASLDVKVYNPAKTPAQVKIDVDVAGKIRKSRTLNLAPGEEERFSLDEKLPEDVKEGKMVLRASTGDKTLLSCTTPFKVGAYSNRIKRVPPPDPDKFAFSVKFNPLRLLLQIHADSYLLPDPKAVRALKYEIKHKETGKVITRGEITKAIAWYYSDVLTLKDVAPGTYEATAQFVLKDGKTFGPRTGTFVKKDEAKAFAHWWGKDPGNSERVLAPFTAIRRRGNAFRCWGREYVFNALGLPDRISSQDGAVMAAPARIVVVVGGRETVIAVGKPKISDFKDWRVRFSGKARGAGLAFAAVGWMEQDGMVQVDLTYRPQDGKPVKVDALRIEYPVADDVAECLVSVGPGNNFAAMTATVLPRDKQGRLWSVFDTGKKGAKMKVGSFYPHVWLGSELRGLQWWADSDKGWFPDDDVPAHEVVREGDAVVLRNNIIGKPVELTGPRTIRFTWIASPFKPLPKGWRMIAATVDGTFFAPHRGVRINPKTGKKYWEPAWGNCNWINPESDDPNEWAALWAEQKKGADAAVRRARPFDLFAARSANHWGHMSFQLMGYGPKSIEKDVHAYFGDEWLGETWNKTYVDYAMYLLDRACGEGGVVSTYWDLSFPILFGSPLSGLAYQLPDGRWQPGYNSLNCRRFFQRLWAVQDKHGLNPGSVGCHSTQAYLFPALPWIDAVADGERDWNLDASDMDWVDYYPKERMRAMSCPHNWGVGICWMANSVSANHDKMVAAKSRQAEYLWMHDSWINPYLAPAFQNTRMPRPILDWGLNGEKVEYHPYWRNPYAASGDRDVLVSLWRIPGEADGRILVGIFNYDRKNPKDISVKIDLAKLGMAGKRLEMRDLYAAFLDSPLAKGRDPIGLEYWSGHVSDGALAMLKADFGSAAEFDPASGVLRIKGLGPHRGRFIGLGATDPVASEALAKQLPAWAAGQNIAAAVRDQGFVRAETKYFAPGQAPGVTCADAAIEVAMWQLPDRVLLAVYNADEQAAKDAVLNVDLKALNLTPKLPWQDFIGVRTLYAENKAPRASLDYYGNKLTLKSIPPKAGRLVAVRRY